MSSPGPALRISSTLLALAPCVVLSHAACNMQTTALLFLFLLLIICGRLPSFSAEQCGRQAGGAFCPNGLCCSRFGYCGNTCPYCGPACQSQCRRCARSDSVPSVITSSVFDQFLSQNRGSGCPSDGFYTYDAFIAAAGSFTGFGTAGDSVTQKREIAAFFAHVAHETGSGCYVEEINKTMFCDSSSVPCAPGQKYYGRGPLQLAWNYNYQAAGEAVGFGGINDPGRVSSDPTASFQTALWYWMTQRSPTGHDAITGGQGFGATIKAINGGLECGPNANQAQQQARISLYRSFCSTLNVDPGANLGC